MPSKQQRTPDRSYHDSEETEIDDKLDVASPKRNHDKCNAQARECDNPSVAMPPKRDHVTGQCDEQECVYGRDEPALERRQYTEAKHRAEKCKLGEADGTEHCRDNCSDRSQ
jgi:hypothetical protein